MDLLTNFLSNTIKAAPGTEFKYYYVMAGLIAILLIGAYVFKRYFAYKVKHNDFVFKHIFKKVPVRMVYFSIGFIFLTAVRYENIPYFAMRLWMYLLLLGLIVTIAYYVYKFIKVYPKELQNFRARSVTKQETVYTPHKKKK